MAAVSARRQRTETDQPLKISATSCIKSRIYWIRLMVS